MDKWAVAQLLPLEEALRQRPADRGIAIDQK
jgi:hypothetical protein